MRHGIEHERFFDIMRAQGIEIDPFLRFFEKTAFGVLEPIAPKSLRLAVTVAAEHFTATFAEIAFERGVPAKYFHPTMRDLLMWHAAEEIEHKAVAFDVLQKVDPRYEVRVAGLVVATVLFVGFWWTGAAMLLRQEKGLSLRRLVSERREGKKRGMLGPEDLVGAIRKYLRRDFHPSQNDNYDLARRYFETIATA
jgi:predicted metal-dependent hydrolase